jgi:hypothetical protein
MNEPQYVIDLAQKPFRHLIGLSGGQFRTGQTVLFGSIQRPFPHINGVCSVQPKAFGHLS